MKLSRRVYLLLVVAAITASVSVVVYATVSQVFPAVTVPPLTFATQQNCPTLNIQNVPSASAGTLIANCLSGTTTVAAFKVTRDGSSTPTFTIVTSAGILTHTPRNRCRWDRMRLHHYPIGFGNSCEF